MFGERAFDLIKDLERQLATSTSTVPSYDENGVRQILDEMQILFEQNTKEMQGSMNTTMTPDMLAGITLRHAGLQRDRDCLLAYMSTRLERICDLRWEKGSVLPESDVNNMTEQENQFFSDYNKMLATYMREIGAEGDYDGLDLTEHMEPPKSHMVYFRVLKDYGEFEPEDGKVIILQKQGIHHLPKYQCETLVRQGVIEILED